MTAWQFRISEPFDIDTFREFCTHWNIEVGAISYGGSFKLKAHWFNVECHGDIKRIIEQNYYGIISCHALNPQRRIWK